LGTQDWQSHHLEPIFNTALSSGFVFYDLLSSYIPDSGSSSWLIKTKCDNPEKVLFPYVLLDFSMLTKNTVAATSFDAAATKILVKTINAFKELVK
jgi:hypothetical protein